MNIEKNQDFFKLGALSARGTVRTKEGFDALYMDLKGLRGDDLKQGIPEPAEILTGPQGPRPISSLGIVCHVPHSSMFSLEGGRLSGATPWSDLASRSQEGKSGRHRRTPTGSE